ncbi:LysR family transcriptional regulator [Escherichia coli]|nr:LysR family transcriptional regulator [Escherichia coli]
MRDDLNAIPVFVTVVESGNFASAAAILSLSPCDAFGGGKNHVARLEARLGVALFQRTTRRQLLTEEGGATRSPGAGKRRSASARPKRCCSAAKMRCRGGCGVSLPVLFGQRCVAPLLFRLEASAIRY